MKWCLIQIMLGGVIMGYIRERVSYLKGLAEGLKINTESNEGKMISAVIEVLDDIVLVVEDLEEGQSEMSEQISDMDEDLSEVEEVIFGEGHDIEDDLVTEIECPSCNEKVQVYEDMLDETGNAYKCPKCEKDVEIEWECSCEDKEC
jgi:predicted RNA-binding Zn-ribbon protein involved in translation (DUF1610 family)